MNQSLYKINRREEMFAEFISVSSSRGDYQSVGVEKAVPSILHYNLDGSFEFLTLDCVLSGLVKHPYQPNSKMFSEERLADLEVSALYSLLEHFPNLPKDSNGEPHKLAEFIYSNMVYLKPSENVVKALEKLDFIKSGKLQAKIFQALNNSFEKEFPGLFLDFKSVPKRKVGTMCYVGQKSSGIGFVPELFSFGLSNIIPRERIVREVSSLKVAEEFINPQPVFGVPKELSKYFSSLRVGIIFCEESMMDGGDLFASGIPKIACKLTRETKLYDFRHIPDEDLNIKTEVFRAGITLYHSIEKVFDETEIDPGTIRFVFPAGVKVAAQALPKEQAFCQKGNPIDMFIDFRTFEDKGALACLLIQQGINSSSPEKARQFLSNLKTEKVYFRGKEYDAFVGDLPVLRPGQRYLDLCKPSKVTFDPISYALTGQRKLVNEKIQREYDRLRNLILALENQVI